MGEVSRSCDLCGRSKNGGNESEEAANAYACVPQRFFDVEFFVGDNRNGERGDDSRRIDGIGHRQKPNDIFALECKVCRDNADCDND